MQFYIQGNLYLGNVVISPLELKVMYLQHAVWCSKNAKHRPLPMANYSHWQWPK